MLKSAFYSVRSVRFAYHEEPDRLHFNKMLMINCCLLKNTSNNFFLQ